MVSSMEKALSKWFVYIYLAMGVQVTRQENAFAGL